MKNKIMKLPLIIFIVSLIVSIVLVILFLNMNVSDIKGSPDGKLSGCLFDKLVLDRNELSWFEKPENAQNDKQYINQENRCYIYECEFGDVSQSETYVEKIFDSLISKNYTVAYLLQDGSNFQDKYNRVKISEDILNFLVVEDNNSCYTFYYTSKSKNMLSELNEGLNMGCLKISFEIFNKPSEGGKYIFKISLGGTPVYNVAINN